MFSSWIALMCWICLPSSALGTPFINLGLCTPDFGHNASICDGGITAKRVSMQPTEDIDESIELSCFHLGFVTVVKCIVSKDAFCSITTPLTRFGIDQCDVGCHTHYRCSNNCCAPRASLCNGQCDGCCSEGEIASGPGFKCARNGRWCKIPHALVSDGVRDCDNGEDEQDLGAFFVCNDKALVPKLSVCDGVVDCADNSDECFCPGSLPKVCKAFPERYVLEVDNSTVQSDDPDLCPINDPCPSCTRCESATLDHRDRTIVDSVCKVNLIDKSRAAFELCGRCDYKVDCINGADELNCSNTDGRHYCTSKSPPYVRPSRINDGRRDCSDGSDECLEQNGSNSLLFHSRYVLIGNTILFVLVWMILLFALVGNIIVFVQETRTLSEMRHKLDVLSSLRANHLLVLNLTLANLVMVIYLLCLGISYERLRGVYCQEELKWRSSSMCSWMGSLVVVSTETSVQTLLLLTVVRFYSVLKPYKANTRPHLKLILPLIALIWIISIVVAWLPLTQLYRRAVPDQVWIEDNAFLDHANANLTAGKQFLYRYSAYLALRNSTGQKEIDAEIFKASEWSALQEINMRLTGRAENFKIRARFTYYSTHSVCIPDMFPDRGSSHWALSLIVTNFNFLSFVAIAALYLAIYMKTVMRSAGGTFKADAATMQWKVFRLTAANFCCWVPIYVLAYLSFSGISIQGDAYVVAAIVLLPMNSAVSPLLYSSAIPRTINYARGVFQQLNANPRRKSVEMTEL